MPARFAITPTWWAIALAGAAGILILQGLAISRQSVTSDEAYAALAGYQADRYGQNSLNLEHPPLLKMLAALPLAALPRPLTPPLLVDDGLQKLQEVYAQPAAERRARFGGRAVVLCLFGLPLVVAAFLLGRALGGAPAGIVLALLLGLDFSFFPLLGMIYTDVAPALGFAVALLAAHRYLRCPAAAPAIGMGLGLGLAIVGKYTGLFVVPALAVALLLARDPASAPPAHRRRSGPGTGAAWAAWRRRLLHGCLALAVAWVAVEAVYAIANRRYDPAAGRRSIELYCTNHATMQVGDRMLPYQRFLLALERRDPRLAQWMTGLLATGAQNAIGTYPTCNFGRMHSQGLWWYFPVLLLARTPLPLLAASAAALAAALAAWVARRRAREREAVQEQEQEVERKQEAALEQVAAVEQEAAIEQVAAREREGALRRRFSIVLAVAAGVYLAMAMTSNYNAGLRHLLPVLPILYLPAALWLARRPRAAAAVCALLLVEALALAPLWVSATNTWWLGTRNPMRFALSTDNCYYLQNLIALRRAVDRHGYAPFYVIDPAIAAPQAAAYLGAGVSHAPDTPMAPGVYAVGTAAEVCVPAILRSSPGEMFAFDRYRAIALRWQPAVAAVAAAGDDLGYAGGNFHLYRLHAAQPAPRPAAPQGVLRPAGRSAGAEAARSRARCERGNPQGRACHGGFPARAACGFPRGAAREACAAGERPGGGATMSLAAALSCCTFLAGAALLVAALRGLWGTRVGWRAAAAYAALTLAFFALPLLGGRLQAGTDLPYVWRPWAETVAVPVKPANNLVWDIGLQMLPFRTLVRQRLLAGEAPLWASELGTGQPLLGNAQSAPFAPLHLLALALPPERALTVAAAWQMLVGLLLMHALARALGAGGAGATVAALAFALSTFAVAWMYHPIAMTAAWTPGVLLGLLALRRGEPRALTALVACGLAMALGGNPETLAQGALLAAAFTAALLLRPGPPGGRARFAGKLCAATVLTAALAAPALLPFLEALPQSERLALLAERPNEVQPPPFQPRFLAPIASPLALGSPRDGAWSGPPHTNFNELCGDYAGLATLALAVAGALACGGRIAALLAGGVAALLAALRIAPFYQAVRAVPLLGDASAGRLRLLFVVAVALAAGLALDRLTTRPRARGAAAFLLLAATAGAACLPPNPGTPWPLAAWGAALASVLAALGALAVPRLRRHFPRVTAAGLAIELCLLGVRYQPAVAPRLDLAPPPAVAFLTSQAAGSAIPDLASGQAPGSPSLPEPSESPARLASPRPLASPGSPFRVAAEGGDLHANLGALYGLWDPRGNDAMRPAAAARVTAELLRPGQQPGDQLALGPLDPHPGLDYLSIRYLLLVHDRQPLPPWRPVYDGIGGKVWENPGALPLFFMPRRVVYVRDDAQALRATLRTRDFANRLVRVGPRPLTALAVVGQPAPAPAAVSDAEPATVQGAAPATTRGSAAALGAGTVQHADHAERQRAGADSRPGAGGPPAQTPGAAIEQTGAVRSIRAHANGFDMDVATASGGIVASSVSWAPGWQATVDTGHDLPVCRVNAGFLGFDIPSGTHHVHLEYRPRGWVWGLRLAAAAAAVAILALAARQSRRRGPLASSLPMESAGS